MFRSYFQEKGGHGGGAKIWTSLSCLLMNIGAQATPALFIVSIVALITSGKGSILELSQTKILPVPTSDVNIFF